LEAATTSCAPTTATIPDHITYATEAEFLDALRKFYDWETSKNVYPEKVSDLVAWKLILRLMRR
jgi:hypothetical protein